MTFKNWYHTDFGALISNQLKNIYFGPPTDPPDPQNVKILNFFLAHALIARVGLAKKLPRRT